MLASSSLQAAYPHFLLSSQLHIMDSYSAARSARHYRLPVSPEFLPHNYATDQSSKATWLRLNNSKRVSNPDEIEKPGTNANPFATHIQVL
jgi:hypothetical protein